MLHALSTLVLVLVAAGVILRKRLKLHLGLMSSAFAVDVALVIYIEITRHAVENLGRPTSALLWFHIAVSTAVLAAYVAQIELGRRILAGFIASRSLHVRLGVAFCTLRALNYVTSFMIR